MLSYKFLVLRDHVSCLGKLLFLIGISSFYDDFQCVNVEDFFSAGSREKWNFWQFQ